MCVFAFFFSLPVHAWFLWTWLPCCSSPLCSLTLSGMNMRIVYWCYFSECEVRQRKGRTIISLTMANHAGEILMLPMPAMSKKGRELCSDCAAQEFQINAVEPCFSKQFLGRGQSACVWIIHFVHIPVLVIKRVTQCL